ncbi:MAG: DUF1772 domain-containing protein [Bacteroidota bacterium]
MKKIFLYVFIIVASGILFTNIYNSLVDARSWAFLFPESVETARLYFKNVNPGIFYRLFSPILQALGLVCVILFWKGNKRARLYLIIALIIYVLADIFTFAYFYPRNDIIFFQTAIEGNTEKIKVAIHEWAFANWIRSLIVLAGITFSSLALHTIYKRS